MNVETVGQTGVDPSRHAARLQIRLLGPMRVQRDGVDVALPRSRKARALLAYLAMARAPVTRGHLCDLFWDQPSDPRSELRWCLSRLRVVLDRTGDLRIRTGADTVSLHTSADEVDALALLTVTNGHAAAIDHDELLHLAQYCDGEFLDGLSGGVQLEQWLLGERRRLRAAQIALLRRIVEHSATDVADAHIHVHRWLQLEPFDLLAHKALLRLLVEEGHLREADEQLVSSMRTLREEGLDPLPLHAELAALKRNARTDALIITASDAIADAEAAAPSRRASIAILPFLEDQAGADVRSRFGDGLVDDIITRLAKLRVLQVIARGSTFAIGDRLLDASQAGRVLGVDYIAAGSVRRANGRFTVAAQLTETRGGSVVWADRFAGREDDALMYLEEVGNRIVASISEEVELTERNRAILKPPSSLDAWEAYHCGLWHMYRFNEADTQHAMDYFQRAVKLDPTFSRAYAGLSFTHFQNAFLHRPAQRREASDLAYDAAGQSMLVDNRDPAAHWAMGRALWLRGQVDDSLIELQQAVEMSPNFAIGHYTVGFVHCQSGDAQLAIDAVDTSRRLSPFDPMLFGMNATRAMGHVRLGDYVAAAHWARKAIARPNAHEHVLSIAASCLAVAGQIDEGRAIVATIRQRHANYTVDDFLGAFRLAPEAEQLFRANAGSIGLTKV